MFLACPGQDCKAKVNKISKDMSNLKSTDVLKVTCPICKLGFEFFVFEVMGN